MSIRARHTHRTRLWGVAGAVFAVCGITAIVVGLSVQQSAPQPPASAAIPVAVTPDAPPTPTGTSGHPTPAPSTATDTAAPPPAAGGTTTSASTTTTTEPDTPVAARPPAPAVTGPILKRSLPTRLSIPAIGVTSNLTDIGLESNGEITTPPLAKDSHAYWLDVSPTPGQLGPSVILGHVDSAAFGPAVFFDLGKLRQRDTIEVTLADQTVAVFEVTHVDEYKKAEFPTQAVYGNTDRAELRLMTCGGTFNQAERSYESNIVVYAALVGSHPAP